MATQHQKLIAPWTLSALVSGLAVYAWGQSFDWQADAVNAYQFFPVLGLLAFSLMWAHYIVGSVKHTLLAGADLTRYFSWTSYAVLVALALHPGILVYQLFRDGFGLPPASYEHFVAPSLSWATLLGTVCLLIFLAFELRRWYREKPWWQYVVSAGDAAMLGIFYHGLRLGSQLQGGWYHWVWWFYGVTLLGVLARKYVMLLQHKSSADDITSL